VTMQATGPTPRQLHGPRIRGMSELRLDPESVLLVAQQLAPLVAPELQALRSRLRMEARTRTTSLKLIVVVAAAAAMLAAAPPALAGTAEIEVAPPAPRTGPQAFVHYTADAGETNTVVVTRETATSFLVRDATAPVTPGRHCTLLAPNEVRCALSGNDVSVPFNSLSISAGDGDDSIDLSGASIRARVSAGTGDDVVQAPRFPSELAGDDGNDVLRGGAQADSLLGGPGHDVLLGGAGSDALDGDALSSGGIAGSGNDRLLGGGGRDLLVTAAGRDRLDGQARDDMYVIAFLGHIRGGTALDTGTSRGDRMRVCITVICEGRQCRGVRVTRTTVRRARQVVTHRAIERLPCRRASNVQSAWSPQRAPVIGGG
jgi:RTX calcium-binding nonapeptide repeat (4 copies)